MDFKEDAEGYDAKVLYGAKRTFDTRSPIVLAEFANGTNGTWVFHGCPN